VTVYGLVSLAVPSFALIVISQSWAMFGAESCISLLLIIWNVPLFPAAHSLVALVTSMV